MTAGPQFDRNRLLLQATDRLVLDHPQIPAGRVIAAVARANLNTHELYAARDLLPPPPEDFVAQVIGMAEHNLSQQFNL